MLYIFLNFSLENWGKHSSNGTNENERSLSKAFILHPFFKEGRCS